MTIEYVSEHENLVIYIMSLMTQAYQTIYIIAKQVNLILNFLTFFLIFLSI